MSGSRDRPDPPGFEIPDLDLPPPNRSQSTMRAVTPPASGPSVRPPASAKPALEEELADALGGPGGSLDLELGGPISSGSYAAYQGSQKDYLGGGLDLESVLPAHATKLTVAPEHKPGWPHGTTPPRDRIALDPLEIRLLAGFGEPPSFGPLLAVYALRVFARKRALVGELQALDGELERAEKQRDDLLCDLAAELRPELQGHERYARLLAPLFDLDALATERGAALATIQREKAADAARLEAEQAPLLHALTVESERLAHCAEELQSKAQVLERADVRHKRSLIEIRAVEQLAAQRTGPAGGDMPPDLVARLLPLQTQAEGTASDLAAARAEHDALRAEHDAGARRVAELERRSEELERRKRDSARRHQERLAPRSEGLSEVKTKHRAALADVGRAILAAGGGIPVDAARLATLTQADAAVAALVTSSELHVRALDTADTEKVKSGLAWIAAVVVGILAYVAYRIW